MRDKQKVSYSVGQASGVVYLRGTYPANGCNQNWRQTQVFSVQRKESLGSDHSRGTRMKETEGQTEAKGHEGECPGSVNTVESGTGEAGRP